jgi:perosamine synthetase
MMGPWVTDYEIGIVAEAMRDWYEHPYFYCEEFQRQFALYHDRRHGLMTPNCTSAIHLVLAALGVGPGDEVIVPDCTWIATAAPVSYLGAEPVFCDIDAVHWCLDPESVARSISPRTKAMIVVDLYGNMPLMDELLTLATDHGLPVIEDAAEALGSKYKGVRAGKFGIASVFSFHRTKTLTTGEGGMLLLDDPDLLHRCMVLRDHGREPGGPMYYNASIGYKYMPSNIQAALGYAQLQRIDELLAWKRKQLEAYREGLGDIPGLELNPEPEGGINGAWSTAMVLPRELNLDKETAMRKLADVGIPSRPFFYPLSSLPAYSGYRERYEIRNSRAYDISNRGVHLPGAATLTQSQMDRICDAIRSLVGSAKASAHRAKGLR